MNKIDEKEIREIITEIKNDNIGIERLYKKYSKLIYGIVFCILKNKEDSEDVLHIIFEKLCVLDKEKWPVKGEFSWLYSFAKNETVTYLRKKKNYVNIEDIYDVQDECDDIQEFIEHDKFKNMISKLNDEEREIVSLKILSGFSFENISKLLNKPTGTIKWKYYKSIHTLKILLGNLGMFILTFVIGLKTLSLTQKEQSNADEEKVQEDNENQIFVNDTNINTTNSDTSSASSTSEKEEQENLAYEDSVSQENEEDEVKEETIIEVKENSNNANYYSIGFFSISAIFLIITIIFTIFFTKYQLKGKKKTSK